MHYFCLLHYFRHYWMLLLYSHLKIFLDGGDFVKDYLVDFAHFLREVKKCSKNTYDLYLRDITRFSSYCKSHRIKDAANVMNKDIYDAVVQGVGYFAGKKLGDKFKVFDKNPQVIGEIVTDKYVDHTVDKAKQLND